MKSQAEANANMNRARGVAAAGWTPYLAFFVGDPLAGGTEPSGNGYARQQITFGPPAGYIMSNSVLLTFPTPTGPWGGSGVALTHAGYMDAVVGGVCHHSYVLGGTDAERTVNAGVPAPQFPPGTITWTES